MSLTVLETTPQSLTLQGRLDTAGVCQLERQPPAGIANGAVSQLDLAKVDGLDTAGLAWLLLQSRAAQQRGQPLAIVNAPDSLLKLAKLSDVDRVLSLQ